MTDEISLNSPTGPIATGRSASGFTLVIAATAIVGVAGYVITWMVPRIIGVGPYATFAIFWSFAFLVAAALSGVQQEVTRATRPVSRRNHSGPPRARNFAAAGGLVSAGLVLLTAPFWVDGVFPTEGWSLVWPLAVGTGSYVLLAVLTGTLYGLSQWRSLFWVIILEGLLRLALIAVTLLFSSDPVPLAWAVAVPFPTTVLVLWPVVRRHIVNRTQLDVGYRGLSWNVARTIVAAGSMGLLVSGFPVLLGLTSQGESREELGLLILAATLTRAPLIVVGMALQSYFIVLFRNRGSAFWRTLLSLEGVVLALGAVLAVVGWWLGPAVFRLLFPGQLVPSGALIAALAVSSALVGALCITAPAVLARAKHSIFTAGWLVAALATIACLLLPMPLVPRTVLALTVAPTAGLIVHCVYLTISTRRRGGLSGPSV